MQEPCRSPAGAVQIAVQEYMRVRRVPFYVIALMGLIAAGVLWWMVGTAEMMTNADDSLEAVRAELLQTVQKRYGLEDLPPDAHHAMIGRAGPDRSLLDTYLLLFTDFNKSGAFDIRRFNVHARHGRVRPADVPAYFESAAPMYTAQKLREALRPGLHLRVHLHGDRHGMGLDSDERTAKELARLAAANLESITGTYPPPIVLDKNIPLEHLRAQEDLVRRFPAYNDIPSIELLELLRNHPTLSDHSLRIRYAAGLPAEQPAEPRSSAAIV